ncbi:25412_t:CDS:2, partial [Gigaspora margarita]
RSKKQNNGDDILMIDNAYDLEDKEAAETVFEKLIKNACNLDKDSCWRYNRNSVRTRQRKLQENRINAIGSRKITEFFDKANDMNLNNDEITQSDYASESETEIIEKSSQWEQKLQETKERIQYLIDTNEISKTDKVKYIFAIHYIKLLQNNTPKLEASQIVVHIHNGTWAKKCLEDDFLPPSQHGKHPSKSLFYNEYVSLRIANYLRTTKFQVTSWLVKEYFEKYIFLKLYIDRVQTISLATLRRWMNKIRFNYKRYKKGVYVNGHEREDVIIYRWEFLQKMEEYDRLMPKWKNINCEIYKEPNLLPGEKKHILITHDECVFHANDSTREFWGPEEEQPLRKKELGKGLHVSEFLTETIRRLKDEKEEARVIVKTDRNWDENWDRKKLLSQVKNAIGIFERMHLKYIGIWAFDNATSHTVMASNALVAARMNLYPGKAFEKMDYELTVSQSDFLNERKLIQQEIEKNRHKDFYNEIIKIFTLELKNNVPIVLDSIPVKTIRKYARLSYRWMDAYRKGLTDQAANYTIKNTKAIIRFLEQN